MRLNVTANAIIDNLMQEIDEVERAHKFVPRGTYVAPGSAYEDACKACDRANQKIQLAIDMLDIDAIGILRAARRWYNQCEWQYCLPEDVAARLVSFYAVRIRKDELADKRPGTIAEWSERTKRWRATA